MTQKTITQIKTSNDLGDAQVGDYFPANRGAGNTGTVNWAPKVNQDPSPQLASNLDLNGKNLNTTTPTEVGYVHGVTSNIQTQFNAIPATYSPIAGSTSIVTVGTITTGTWNATGITVPYGGTGLSSTTSYGILTGGTTSTGALQNAGAGTSGQFYQSQGASSLGVWTTSSGSGNVAMTTSPIFTTPALGTPSSGVLSSCTGYPTSGLTGLGTGVATALGNNIGSAGAPVTFNGALGTPSSGTLTSVTGLPLTTGVTGTLPVANGGSGVNTTTAFGLLAGGTTSTGAWQNIGVGSNGQVVQSNGAGILPSYTSTLSFTVQGNITTTGTIGTGTWQATLVGLTYGGTGANLTASLSNGGIVYSTASAMAILAGTATAGQMLRSGTSAAPSWSTATYPATTTVSQLLYSSSANTVAGLATANSSTLVTNSSGVPGYSTTVPAAVIQPSGGTLLLNDQSTNPGFAVYWSGGTTVNYARTYGSTTGNSVNIDCATSSDANVYLTLNGKGTSGVNVIGKTNGSMGIIGCYGELLQSAFATSVAMTSATVTQVQTLSLTAGDWDVWATFATAPGATTTQSIITAGLNLTTATLPTPTSAATASRVNLVSTVPANTPVFLQTGIYPIAVSTTTSIFLNASVTYAVSTLTGGGMIFARRRS